MDAFLQKFNPDFQQAICQSSNECLFGEYPTLTEIKRAYGEKVPIAWMIPQLYDLSQYCGAKEKLQGKPLEECAFVIATEFYFLKVSELMLFFHRFKTGRYGRFYGSVDPLLITMSLREFVKERNMVIERHEQELLEKEAEEHRKHAVSYEEYLRLKNRNK